MKIFKTRFGMASAALFALMIIHTPARAQGGPNLERGCSNATLSGAWGFHLGAKVAPAGTPLAVIGRQVFDGKGTVSARVTINDKGTIIRVDENVGSYAVNPDCTGRIMDAAGTTFDFIVVDGGKEAYFWQTNPSNAVFLFGAAKKQFPDDKDQAPPFAQAGPNAARRCSNATIQGSYGFQVGATLAPDGSPLAVMGHQMADGKGHQSSTVTINAAGTIFQANDFGTYIVNADCTGRIVSGTGGGTIEFVLVDGGNEGYFLQTDPPAGVFVFSVIKKQFPSKN